MALLAGAAVLGVVWVDGPPPPPGPRFCGVALGLFASDPDWDYEGLLGEIAEHGATDVLLSVPWVQEDIHASTLGPRPGQSPSGDTLVRTIRQAQAHGLAVSLMPVVRLVHREPGAWRGALEPQDRDAWFAAYEALLLDHARVTEAEGAVRLVVGSELSSLEGDESRWRRLLARVRQQTDATLTWSANWDRFEAVPFWDALDEVGVSAWFPPAEGWEAPRQRLAAVQEQTGKPLLFTEVGYPARDAAAVRPWDHAGRAASNPPLQARLFSSFFDEFHADPALRGLFVWNWFGVGGTVDAGYSPRGRPAAGVIKHRFQRWCGAAPLENG